MRRSRIADLVRAKVVQGSGKHCSGRMARQERGQVRHEPAAEGGAARLQQALQVLLSHCLHRNRHGGWQDPLHTCKGSLDERSLRVLLPGAGSQSLPAACAVMGPSAAELHWHDLAARNTHARNS